MAPSHTSSDSSEADEPVYPQAMASSLAGLPVRAPGAANGDEGKDANGAANGAGKAQSGQLKDFLDLAVSTLALSPVPRAEERGSTELELMECAHVDHSHFWTFGLGYQRCEWPR